MDCWSLIANYKMQN